MHDVTDINICHKLHYIIMRWRTFSYKANITGYFSLLVFVYLNIIVLLLTFPLLEKKNVSLTCESVNIHKTAKIWIFISTHINDSKLFLFLRSKLDLYFKY